VRARLARGWQHGQYKDMQAMLCLGPAGCRRNQRLGEPAVEVDGQVRPLLLGAAKRHDRYSADAGKRGYLLVGAVPETHPLSLPDGNRRFELNSAP
jgi:hypothetical protein